MMTNNEHRDAARGYLKSVHDAHASLTVLYSKVHKSPDDWAKISELKTLIHAGYDAAQVHTGLALRDAVIEATEHILRVLGRLPDEQPETLV